MIGSGNMVITKNPTICSLPVKSGDKPKAKGSNGTAKELSYYVNDSVLKPTGKIYFFLELINPIYIRNGNQVTISLAVKYLDSQTKATQISQFDLVLEKNGNWKIVK